MAEGFKINEGKLEILEVNGVDKWVKRCAEARLKVDQEREKPREERDFAQIREWKNIFYVKTIVCNCYCYIPDEAFKGDKNVQELISDNKISIKKEAFAGCTDLRKVSIPKVDSVGVKAFEGCSNLNELDISGVEGIGEEAFAGCTALKIVNVPNVEAIQKNAFQGCDNLEKIEGLGKIKDVNSLYELGCSKELFKGNELIKLSELKGSYKESNSNIYADALHAKYKNFKLKCNSMCTNGKAKEGAFKECARYFMEKVLKPMTTGENVKFKTQVEKLLKSNSEVKISKNYFSDFNQLVLKNCLNVLNSVSEATTLYPVAAVPSCSIEEKVENEVKKLQLDIKNYVLKKYNGLLSAGLKSWEVSKYFGEYFRILLGFAGLEKLKDINAKEVKRNKYHSTFGLGGGGLDLLVMVKECELK